MSRTLALGRAALLLALVVPNAEAQCFNIDFGDLPPVGAVPMPTYAGGLLPGTWNPSAASFGYDIFGLLDCTGAATGVDMDYLQIFPNLGGQDLTFNHPGTAAGDAALYDDFHNVGLNGGGTQIWFLGLAAGSYDVVVHAWAPDSPTTFISAVSSTGNATQVLGGAWPAAPTAGVTFAAFCNIVTDGTFVIFVQATIGFATINGIQIAPAAIPCPGALFIDACSGDGGNQMGCTDCPCGNNAPAGALGGCINSNGTSARLIALGAAISTGTNIGAPLRFEVLGAPPLNSVQLTSGNATAPANAANPCFGLGSGIQSLSLDGLRCVVQGVLRHGVRPSDAAGSVGVTTNGWGTVNGFFNHDAFLIGQTKFFQAISRDNVAAVCQTGQNTTQSVEVMFL